jgi:NAD(P)-dependent dehydrogenase (short-subunit alcohol dehydrogenase family)
LTIARGHVQAGARTIVSSRKTEDVEAAARGLAAVGDCQAIPADISTRDRGGGHRPAGGAVSLAAAVRERFDPLDIPVSSAGVTWGAPLEEFPASGWEQVIHS